MTLPSLHLDLGDSAELAQLLLFIRDWLGNDPTLADSLTAFVGSPHYPPTDLRADLARFAFLLGGDLDEVAFTPDDTA
ncbi:MAG: hypothetical protein NVS9B1_26870 [Candidatus Dormibacteraceae bacterium]